MKMPPRPSSPSSLLWAHQMKRENHHLLGRIQQLESGHGQHENRLKEAESVAKSHASEDIAALAEQVKALDENGINERLAKVEKDVMSKLDDVQAESEAIILKVASLEKDDAVAEEEKRKAFNKEKALLKRLAEVEAELKKYEQSLARVGRRVDEQSVGTIKAQLESLQRQVETEGSEMKLVEESVQVLEKANAELRKANVRLEAEIQKIAEKAAKAAALVAAQPGLSNKRAASELDLSDEEDDTPQPPPKKKKKQSHKWAGGGADKDIIRQGSDLARTPRAATSTYIPARKPIAKPVSKAASQAKPKPAPAKTRQPAPKPAPPPKVRKPDAKPVSTQARKIAAAASQSQRKGKAAVVSQKPALASKGLATAKSAQSQRHLDGRPDKPILRAGKGWVEYAVSPSGSEDEDEEEDDLPTKRTRARKSQPAADIELPRTRGARPQKRSNIKLESEDVTTAHTGAPIEDFGGIFTSPPAPPRRSIEQLPAGGRTATGDALLAAVVTSQSQPGAPPPAPPKRRRIEQE